MTNNKIISAFILGSKNIQTNRSSLSIANYMLYSYANPIATWREGGVDHNDKPVLSFYITTAKPSTTSTRAINEVVRRCATCGHKVIRVSEKELLDMV